MPTDQQIPIAALEEILHEDLERSRWVDHPSNPFVTSAKELGGAELFSGAFNAAATAAASTFTTDPWLLSAAGPVTEKLGFLVWEAGKAVRSKDGSWTRRFTTGVKGLSTTVATDVLYHDPTYIGLMQLMLANGIQPSLASAVSFLAGIPVAAGLQSVTGELSHRSLRRLSERSGFHWERYYETRFLILSDQDPQDAFLNVSAKFNLGNENISRYHDTYHEHRFPAFGNRLGFVRLRDVQDLTGGERTYKDLELSYTFPKRNSRVRPEYNLYYVDKEKGWLDIGTGIPRGINRLIRPTTTELLFDRRIRYDDEIRIVLDTVWVDEARRFSLMELKARHESTEFFEAMAYLLRHASIMTTTYPKVKLVSEVRRKIV